MIRDPSDGSVRGKPEENSKLSAPMPVPEPGMAGFGPVIDPTTSGLQTGSTKPENLARLEKSKTWLRDYRAGKINPKAEGE
jgi:hypothetical protein